MALLVFLTWRKLYQAVNPYGKIQVYNRKLNRMRHMYSTYVQTHVHSYFINLSFIHAKNPKIKMNCVVINRWQISSNSSPFYCNSRAVAKKKPETDLKFTAKSQCDKKKSRRKAQEKKNCDTMTIKMKILSPSNKTSFAKLFETAATAAAEADEKSRIPNPDS